MSQEIKPNERCEEKCFNCLEPCKPCEDPHALTQEEYLQLEEMFSRNEDDETKVYNDLNETE